MSTTAHSEPGQPLDLALTEGLGLAAVARCWCAKCEPEDVFQQRMIVCPSCGDKRCVHARDHEAPCAKDDIYAHNAWVEKRELRHRYGGSKFAGWFKELPSGMNYRLWEQGGHDPGPGDVALYEA